MKKFLTLLIPMLAFVVVLLLRDHWLPWFSDLLIEDTSATVLQSLAALVAVALFVGGVLKAYISWLRPKQPVRSEVSRHDETQTVDTPVVPRAFIPSPELILPGGDQTAPDKSPYLGLHAFSRNDAHRFFGREFEIKQALSAFGDSVRTSSDGSDQTVCWLQVEGNSGAGKSSFVNAGLLPRVENHALQSITGHHNWRIVGPLLPGEQPLRRLAQALQQTFVSDPARRDSLNCETRLAGDEKALAYMINDFINHSDESNCACLLVVDQFEELFTFSAQEQKTHFDRQVANALLDPDCPLYLINTVRIDFLHEFERLPELSELYNTRCCRYLLKTISDEGLREVIEMPAAQVGLDVSEVSNLVRQDARLEPGALPLVENALQFLWERREDNRLLADVYVRHDGIFGMLEARADQLLVAIDQALPEGRARALELLLALTQVNEQGNHSRRRLSIEEARLVAAGKKRDPEAGQRIIDWLSGRPGPAGSSTTHRTGDIRLVNIIVEGEAAEASAAGGITDEPRSENVNARASAFVDLIHETLIRYRDRDPQTGDRIGYWRTLYDYIERNPDRSLYRDRLSRKAQQWQQSAGVARWNALAGLREIIKEYRWFHPSKQAIEYRYLKASKRKLWLQGGLLAILLGVPFQAYVWTLSNNLPPGYIWTLQTFRLMHLGWLDEPLPVMVDIGIPDGEVILGERDQGFIDEVNAQNDEFLKNSGVPSTTAEIEQAFALGAYEVTYEQYDYFVWSSRRSGSRINYPNNPPQENARGQRAVVNVSWHDANGYLSWLSDRTGEPYRLPTEAEWEYAARAGSETTWWWGDAMEINRANCRDCGSEWDNERVAPVGQFAPNAWGLYDTAGNVWEWTCSAWQEQFDGSEARCAEHDDENNGRAVRGGSWGDVAVWVRSSSRGWFNTDGRDFVIGFRVLRAARTH